VTAVRIDIVSIFPEYLAPLQLSLVGKARTDGLIEIHVHDLRDVTTDRHRTVDDEPYGGGPGMVMRPEPWGAVLDSLLTPASQLVVPTPSGRRFDQQMAQTWSGQSHLVIACGRYEGIDARVMTHYREHGPGSVAEVSIGDYVLAGGEVAALVITEAVVRLLPGVVGNTESITDDSFAPGLMADLVEGPVYTRPPQWRGLDVPEVLRSGDHGRIAAWRRDQAVTRTRAMRPDLVSEEDPAGTPGFPG
jgi:tRNA (guanine37-N1)-methyltransferase